MPSNKRRVYLSMYHRDEFTIEARRQGSSSYHWAILVAPKVIRDGRVCEAYDVTNGKLIDEVRRINLNPNQEWRYRNRQVDPKLSSHLLGIVMIGKIEPSNPTSMSAVLGNVPVPRNGMNPPETCRTWTQEAIRALQAVGLAEQFHVHELFNFAVDVANRAFDGVLPVSVDNIHNYTSRPL